MAFYRPIAAQGFRFSPAYTELLPCAPLRPFVHSFWGNEGKAIQSGESSLVIPDTCMDLIFRINYASGEIQSCFCAIDDAAYYTAPINASTPCATFGIRFFAWSAVAFCEDSLQDCKSLIFPAQALFPSLCREIMPILPALHTLAARAKFAESILLRHIRPERISPDTMNALSSMVSSGGRLRVREIAQSLCLSERQLERLIRRDLGASPKLMAQLIRHQMIYRELLEGRFCAAEAVEHYGYADQSHLIRDFRRFHLLSPNEVLAGV